MRIFIQIVISLLLAWWPIVALTSVMMFGGPNAGNDPKLLRMAIAVILYPAVIGLALYFFKFSLWGIAPKWLLIATIAVPIVGVFVLDYPRMLMNANAGIPNSGYFKNETSVYHDGQKIAADPGTFQVLDIESTRKSQNQAYYAKDASHVFLHGKLIKGADPSSFEILSSSNWNYSQDSKNVFYDGKLIEGIDRASFSKVPRGVDDEQYFTDGVSLVYFGKVIGKTDRESIESLGNSYAKDRTQVFYMDKPIENADPASFKIIDQSSYSSDKSRVYFWHIVVPQAKPEHFQVLERGYSKDDNRVYHQHSIEKIDIVEGAIAADFKVTLYDEQRGSEAFDGRTYFMNGKPVPSK